MNTPNPETTTSTPQLLHGQSGMAYEIIPVTGFYSGEQGLLDTFVKDEQGNESYIITKNPAIQMASTQLGNFFVAKDPALSRLHFPAMQFDAIDGQEVALMERFDDHREFTHLHEDNITPDERAFLAVFNTFIGNWDYKKEHVLVPHNASNKVGLIDFDKAMDFDNEFGTQSAQHHLTQFGEYDPLLVKHYIDMFRGLQPSDWEHIDTIMHESGLPSEIADNLFGRLQQQPALLATELHEAGVI